jgi:hypothetical protein
MLSDYGVKNGGAKVEDKEKNIFWSQKIRRNSIEVQSNESIKKYNKKIYNFEKQNKLHRLNFREKFTNFLKDKEESRHNDKNRGD